jgi:hypothetical protein
MEQTNKNKKYIDTLVWVLFIGFAAWWLYITLFLRGGHHDSLNNQLFASTYGVISLIGGLAGLAASRMWGGYKSLIGRSLLFFSIGLLAQEFGQLAYSYYAYRNIEIPYPSVGDVGYFSSVFFYIYAAWLLLKANGAKLYLRARSKRLIAVVLPLLLLAGSYAFFLRDYKFDFSSLSAATRVILDFGYPLGQSAYISLALLTYLLSRGLLGGLMRRKVSLILVALVVQYAADFSYLEAAKRQTAFPGGANDFLYLLSYALMALALNNFRIRLAAKPAAGAESESI